MKRFLSVLLSAMLALGFAACADDAADDAADTNEDGSGEAAAPPEYTLTVSQAEDGKYTVDMPSDMEGGVITVLYENMTDAPIDIQFAHAVEGHTLDELLGQVTGDDDEPLQDWVQAAGGLFSPPGATTRVTLDLEPGTYWYFATQGPEGEEGEEEPPHPATTGLSGEFTLDGDSGAEMPEGTATVTAEDFSFQSEGLKAGTNQVTFTNTGQQLHHLLALPLADGATFDQAKEALTSEEEPEGPPPVNFEKASSTAVINPGQTVVAELNFEAGEYALVCFMPNKGTAGPPHVAMGMVSQATVA